MIEFMRNGGFLMWPLLILGVVAIVQSTRAALGTGGDAKVARQLATSVLTASIGWSLMGWVVVSRHATDAPPEVLIIGLGEAACPAILGLMIYSLTGLVSTLRGTRLVRS
jgi:hypothetical protein